MDTEIRSPLWAADDLERVTCVACGSGETRRVFTRGDGLKVAVCRCGFGYLSPRPREEHIARLYTGGYFDGSDQSGIGYSGYIADSRRLAADPRAVHNITASALDARYGLRGKKLLDVGAASGVMLAVARDRGAEVHGVEPSAEAARAGRELFGVEIRPGYLGDQDLPAESFDIVTMLEVIEHPPKPRELLRQARHVLKPGGLLALTTPNFGMARYWGARYQGLFVSYEHLYYWTEGALRRVLIEEGFRPESFTGTNLRFVQEHAGEASFRQIARRGLRPIVARLPRDLTATSLLAIARRT